jgi:hypothetical protein
MNSVLDSENLREREVRPKTGSPVQSSGSNLALRDGQGFRIRPLFSAGAKGSRKRRQRPPESTSISLRL